ncbi:hypothetical protein Tco_1249106 [Tanacetum coccineum]
MFYLRLASAAICKNGGVTHTPSIIQPSTSQPQKKQRSRRPKRKDTEVPQPSGPTTNVADKAVNKEMDDSLMRAATTASSLEAEVLDLENTKTAQAQEITSLKLRVKKLEKKGGLRTHKIKRLYKVGRSVRVISIDEASLGDQENASKQGRKIDDIDKDAEITLVDETKGQYGDEEMFDTCVLDGDEVLAEPEVTIKDVNLSVDEVTLAQVLAALKSAKVQEKANVKAQDKGKGIMVEELVKMKKKDQISLDEELAFKLQDEEEEEERLPRQKAQREEEDNIVAWDNVQAVIDADYQIAQQMQAE